MLNLNGILSVEVIREVEEYTELRLRDKSKYQCAQALALYEQRILPNDEIFSMCESSMEEDLYIPATSYVPNDIIMNFHGSNVVPVSYSPMRKIVTCVCLPELDINYTPMKEYSVNVVYTTIYNYFSEYVKHYGKHPDLLDIPAREIIDGIVNEGIELGAAEVTISSVGRAADVFYNVRKKKVNSQRILTTDNIQDIIKLLCFESPIDDSINSPKYVGVTLNNEYRGRVCINKKYHGYAITIRFLPNASFNRSLESCNLTAETIKFLRNVFMDREPGLRLIVGATMSGKNTTALSCLRELSILDNDKIVSIEMPVEQELENVIQINCDTETEYEENINSLLRQNPDFVYITEIGDTTAIPVLRMANTGKRMLASMHANSCADFLGRLVDITGLSPDRVIQATHSIVYQELIRDDENDTVIPKNTYLYLSKERKKELYGRPYGEMLLKLESWEGGDVW